MNETYSFVSEIRSREGARYRKPALEYLILPPLNQCVHRLASIQLFGQGLDLSERRYAGGLVAAPVLLRGQTFLDFRAKTLANIMESDRRLQMTRNRTTRAIPTNWPLPTLAAPRLRRSTRVWRAGAGPHRPSTRRVRSVDASEWNEPDESLLTRSMKTIRLPPPSTAGRWCHGGPCPGDD